MNKSMTNMQKMFVKEYLVDLNATQAAIRAGYSVKNAGKIGPELLGKTRINQEIQAEMKRREERTEVTQDMVVNQLAKIAFLDIKSVVTWNDKNISIRPSDEVDGTTLAEISESTTESGWTKKVKTSDRMRALEMLGRHLGMFTDRIESKNEVTVTFIDDLTTDSPPD